MKTTRLYKILDVLNISFDDICNNTGIDESDLFKLLATGSAADIITLNKISDFLCIPSNLLVNSGRNSLFENDILLVPVFTAFRKPYYIFKLFALSDVKNFSMLSYLSFIPDGFNCTFEVIEKTMNLIYKGEQIKYSTGDSVRIDSSYLLDFDADYQKGSIVLITVC